MRPLQRILICLQHTKKSQHKVLTHLLRLLLMVPGPVPFRTLSRYSPYHEKTFARWYATGFDFVSLNKAAITAFLSEMAQLLARPGVVPGAYIYIADAALVTEDNLTALGDTFSSPAYPRPIVNVDASLRRPWRTIAGRMSAC